MKKSAYCFFVILLLILSFSTDLKASAKDSLIYFKGDYAQSLQQSGKANKTLMIVFSTSWCSWCKKMKSTAFTDEKIISYINSHFVLYELNAEEVEGKKIASSFGVTSYPTIVFLSPEEKQLLTSEGYHEPNDLMQLLKSVIEK